MTKRERATINTGIWGDGDWKSLHFACQWLYKALLTRPDLNHVGVADWRPRKLFRSARGLSVELIEQAAAELQSARFLLIDADSEEVLIRSFMKHDGVLRNPNLGALVKSSYDAVGSPDLQRVIIHELKKQSEREPRPAVFTSEKSQRFMEAMLELQSAPIDDYLNGVPNASTTPFDIRSDSVQNGVDNGDMDGVPSPFKKGDPSTTSTSTPSKEGVWGRDEDFESWWKLYPRKIGKGQARKAFSTALKKASIETLTAGVHSYAESVSGKDQQYIAHPATWLNGERWDDETAPPPSQPKNPWDYTEEDYKRAEEELERRSSARAGSSEQRGG